jgi:hypothetical protein
MMLRAMGGVICVIERVVAIDLGVCLSYTLDLWKRHSFAASPRLYEESTTAQL